VAQALHLGTKVVTLFGIADDQGNVIQRKEFAAELRTLDEAGFIEVCRSLTATRDSWAKQAEEAVKPAGETKRSRKQAPPLPPSVPLPENPTEAKVS
jgi:hypothetical protein